MNLPSQKNRETGKPTKPGKPAQTVRALTPKQRLRLAEARADIGFPGFLRFPRFSPLLVSSGGRLS